MVRKLTNEIWKELTSLPIESLSDRELSQLRRSSRGGSTLTSAVVAEQQRRGLLHPRTPGGGWPKERIKRLQDMSDERPQTHRIEDLSDFRLTLGQLSNRIAELIQQYGDAEIFTSLNYGPHGEDCPQVDVYIRE